VGGAVLLSTLQGGDIRRELGWEEKEKKKFGPFTDRAPAALKKKPLSPQNIWETPR